MKNKKGLGIWELYKTDLSQEEICEIIQFRWGSALVAREYAKMQIEHRKEMRENG
jgi:hypothetical protein